MGWAVWAQGGARLQEGGARRAAAAGGRRQRALARANRSFSLLRTMPVTRAMSHLAMEEPCCCCLDPLAELGPDLLHAVLAHLPLSDLQSASQGQCLAQLPASAADISAQSRRHRRWPPLAAAARPSCLHCTPSHAHTTHAHTPPAAVSRGWREAANDDRLWRALCEVGWLQCRRRAIAGSQPTWLPSASQPAGALSSLAHALLPGPPARRPSARRRPGRRSATCRPAARATRRGGGATQPHRGTCSAQPSLQRSCARFAGEQRGW